MTDLGLCVCEIESVSLMKLEKNDFLRLIMWLFKTDDKF